MKDSIILNVTCKNQIKRIKNRRMATRSKKGAENCNKFQASLSTTKLAKNLAKIMSRL